jgi:hypothetical protein
LHTAPAEGVYPVKPLLRRRVVERAARRSAAQAPPARMLLAPLRATPPAASLTVTLSRVPWGACTDGVKARPWAPIVQR